MTNEYIAVIVDELMGLLAIEPASRIAPADWTGECMARSRRAWDRVARLEDDDDDPRARLSAVVEGEVWEALAVGRPARDVVENLDEMFGRHYRFPRWGCPYCETDGGLPVPLSFDGSGEWSCPSCGCHTVSPYDDACVPLIEMDEGVLGGEMS